MDIALKYKDYIHSDVDHVKWDKVKNYFETNNTINSDLGSMKILYKQSLSKMLNVSRNDGKNISLLSLATMDDNDVKTLLEAAAEQMNKVAKSLASENAAIVSANQIARNAGKTVFASKWAKGTNANEVKEFNDLMSSIGNAIQVLSSNSYDAETWNHFVALYGLVMGKAQTGQAFATELKQLNDFIDIEKCKNNPIMQKIMIYLRNIPATYGTKDKKGRVIDRYSANQMAGSLNNIFGKVIGETFNSIQWDMIESVKKDSQALLLGEDRVQSRWGKSDVDGKVDIAKNGLLDITLFSKKTGKEKYQISGDFTSSVKLYSPGKTSNQVKNISIQSIYSYVNMVLSIFNERYPVYNTLAFSKANNVLKEESFRIIRSSVLARYFIDFIAGGNQKIGNSGIFNTAQFLVINGSFYSIYSIIIQFIEEMQKDKMNYYGSKNDNLISVRFDGIHNDWVGKNSKKDIANALKRSSIAMESVNKIKATIHLNVQALLPYANSKSNIF